MKYLKDRLLISGMDPKGDKLAREYGVGFEVTKFSWVGAFDDPQNYEIVKKQIQGIGNLWLHAPFAELTPCAIDPLVRQVTRRRYKQTIEIARKFGIKSLVIHDGFVPMLYFPQWFVEQSIAFWKDFLKTFPRDMEIALENIMDPNPDMLVEIVREVDDPRLRICLDIGHANTFVSKLLPYNWIEPVAPYLSHAHIHNNEGDKDIHSALGTGTIDMKKVLDALLMTDASITVETMAGKESVEWLVDNGYLE